MKDAIISEIRSLFTFRWKPGKDLLVMLISYLLVVASLYTATFIVGPESGGAYFLVYGGLTALIIGIGLPIAWMVFYRKRPLADLGITSRRLGLSIVLQIIFAAIVIPGGLAGFKMPSSELLFPLLALALTIGFFEAVFWRGWVFNRLEEAFGFIPALILGSALYSLYHIGYGMPMSEMVFLFFIGLMYAAAFRVTRSVFILWPVFQPAGQLITLLKDQLSLPMIAVLGFVEVLVVMWVLIFLAAKFLKKQNKASITVNA